MIVARKVDLKKELKHLYGPLAKEVSVVDVPHMIFLMIDGEGDPNTSPEYADALEALYALSYALKFKVKRAPSGVDYAVMPLEGLWWTDDMSEFSIEDKDSWGAFFYVLYSAGWSPGESTDPGSHLHGAYLDATTMTFAGIIACQVGTAFAARTTRASLREIRVFSNRLLLWGIIFELVFAAAIIYLPPLQAVFGTNALGVRELAILALFPPLVWGTDELRRWARRSREASGSG